jgi:hypothetical protein
VKKSNFLGLVEHCEVLVQTWSWSRDTNVPKAVGDNLNDEIFFTSHDCHSMLHARYRIIFYLSEMLIYLMNSFIILYSDLKCWTASYQHLKCEPADIDHFIIIMETEAYFTVRMNNTKVAKLIINNNFLSSHQPLLFYPTFRS